MLRKIVSVRADSVDLTANQDVQKESYGSFGGNAVQSDHAGLDLSECGGGVIKPLSRAV